MELLDALAQTFDHTGGVIAGMRPDQLAAPTPCREWDVRALLGHTLGVVTNMGRAARGEELLADMNAIPLSDDVSAQFNAEAERTLAAWQAKGFDGDVNVGAGPMPIQVAVSINLVDTATHSWDLARATGQNENLPDDLAAMVLAVGQGFITEEIRGFAGFDPPVPVGDEARPTAQLVAFLGRQP
jgi:uncharacterized protein (TIGR03086 family)